ncbi:unnamed protein product [Diabrotica balteata]|uniref:Homeobox domain-containing protein n=1 Tax=Diabrotica balteata TaxID=107213 RepID=A0A9N9SXL8_DIABA|nr:unnamed protein product [Diabrotica balteata]
MSFFIDDILRSKDPLERLDNNHSIHQTSDSRQNVPLSYENSSSFAPLEKRSDEHRSVNLGFSDQRSILHQTLINRLNSPYYRTSDHRGPPLENYQHFCYDPGYINYYRTLYDRDYCSINRQKPWTPSPYDNQANYLSYAMQYKYMYSPSKRKGGQVRFTANQTDILEKRFCSNKYLSPEERKVLAESLTLSDRQVKTWFQNRRAKWRRSNSGGEQTQENTTDDETKKTNADSN